MRLSPATRLLALSAATVPAAALVVVAPAGASGSDPSVAAAKVISAQLVAVSQVPHSADAFALGRQSTSSSYSSYVVHRHAGRWHKVKGTIPSAIQVNGIAAGSVHSVWVVGNASNDAGTTPVIEHSSGGKFHRVKLPKLGFASLSSVSATSKNNAYAAGTVDGAQSAQSLLLHWNGHKWSRESLSSHDTSIQSISASSTTNVWMLASGSSGADLIRFNGKHATSKPHPTPSASSLVSIATTSAHRAWAVGYRQVMAHGTYTAKPFAVHWNGHKWSTSKAPGGGVNSYLDSVGGSGAAAWAVGYESTSNTKQLTRPLILHWTGSSWHRQTAPHRGDNSQLTAVSAGTANSATAVGVWYRGAICGGGTPGHAYSVSLSGRSWSAPATPDNRPALRGC
jgi:hypothetical protein